ncbi:MAG: DUF5018 domain-containing protein [Treponema sp.]|jgi:hypothetical protein|nr:DUF5018 domain-containing protein [Treponema sp.]
MKQLHKESCPCLTRWRGILLVLALFIFAGCPQAADTVENPSDATGENAGEQPGEETDPPDNNDPADPPGEGTNPPAITKFIIAEIEGLIDEEAHPKTITLILPAAISREILAPEISLSDPAADVEPASGEERDFTKPVEYTLSLDGVQTIYQVIVKNRVAITGFRIGETAGIINEDADPKTITLTMPAGTDVGSLSPVITLSDPAAAVEPASGETRDFREPLLYALNSEGVETRYQVTVTVAASDASDARAITGFRVNGVDGVIDGDAKTITLTLPFGTGLNALTPEINLSEGAVVQPASGEAQNFANSILIAKKYTVTAENGMQAEYKVTVQTASHYSVTLTVDKEISFSPAAASFSRNETTSVSATAGYDQYQWSVDGNAAGTDSRIITLSGGDYFIGSHYLGVTAWQQGIPFYAELVFTITP